MALLVQRVKEPAGGLNNLRIYLMFCHWCYGNKGGFQMREMYKCMMDAVILFVPHIIRIRSNEILFIVRNNGKNIYINAIGESLNKIQIK